MGRTINADKFKKQLAVMTIKENYPVDKANAIIALIEMQPTAIDGVVTESEYAHRRFSQVRPTKHSYEEPGEKPYVKYSCPVCEALGNLHQVVPVQQNCTLCGVYLYWGECESAHEKR